MAVTAPPTINALPAPPDPNNRATYNTLAYPWSVALGPYSTQLAAVAANVYANATDAAASAAGAANQAGLATTNGAAQVALATAQAVIAAAKAGQTTADASATAADRVQTGLDRAAAAASAASAAAIAGAFVGTSDSSLIIGAGSKTFITQAGEQYSAGIWMTAVSRANPANWMFGEVTSYVGTNLVIDVQTIGGSGTCADWNLSLSGPRGAQGPQGIPGALAGVATGAIDLLTGAAIASAATVNLDAATGNRVHITGTTPITAVTLTRGPRTVIFDGALTLTHHATNNNLPGGANIMTAQGDRAIYESDGVTVYCVDYIRANGMPITSSDASLIRSPRTANAILGLADKGIIIDVTSGSFTQTISAAAVLGNGWSCWYKNSGSGAVTLDPNGAELIDGNATAVVAGGELLRIYTDGTAFFTWRIEEAAVGSIVTSGRALPTPAWLPCNGGVFNDAVYPQLAALLTTTYPNAPISIPVSPVANNSDLRFTFSGDSIYLATIGGIAPYLKIFKRTGDTYAALPDPASLPAGVVNGCAFSSDGVYLALSTTASPYLTVYKRVGDTFTKLANPTTLPTGACTGVSFSSDGVYLAVSLSVSPWVQVFKRTADTFDILANPASPTAAAPAIALSDDGVYLVAFTANPSIKIWKRTADTFSPIAAPTLGYSPSNVNYVAMAPGANYFSVGFNATPYHQVFSRTGDTFAAFGSPAAAQYGDCAAFSADGRFLALRDQPSIRIFRITSTGLTLLETISCGGRGYDIKFSPDGRYLLTNDVSGTPYAKLFNGKYKTPLISADTGTVTVATTYIRTGL